MSANDYNDTGLSNVELAIRRADILASKERARLANVRLVAAAVFCAWSVGNLIGVAL